MLQQAWALKRRHQSGMLAGSGCERWRRKPEPDDDRQEAAMDFRLLRYFIAVAEELHLARAAQRLGIEQSPLSRAMRELESQLGVQLFDRSTRLTRLTWAGQVFLGECRRVEATA